MFPTELDKVPLFSETSIVRVVFLGEKKALANHFFFLSLLIALTRYTMENNSVNKFRLFTENEKCS